MTYKKPKQFNPRVYAAAAVVWAGLGGIYLGLIFCQVVGRDASRLWEHLILGILFLLAGIGHLWRAWPAIAKSHPWARIGESASSQPHNLP
jgi:hypothetical protein